MVAPKRAEKPKRVSIGRDHLILFLTIFYTAAKIATAPNFNNLQARDGVACILLFNVATLLILDFIALG